MLAAGVAAAAAAALAWLGPPGTDFAAHAYQRTLFIEHGFSLWNNFWYAGRYSFVTYSLLYYPLAALLGIRLLAVATVAVAALAFAIVIWREWGPTTRWSSRTFALVWAGIVLSAAYPFALGVALALLALWALQGRMFWRFAALVLLTLAASPVAFLLLALIVASVGLAKRPMPRRYVWPTLAVLAAGGVEIMLWRAFPGSGTYPFSTAELAAALAFCAIGAGLTWRIEQARGLFTLFAVYALACLAVYLVPSAIGENIARLRYVAIPVAVLALSLRRWKPLWASAIALALAISWNVTPLLADYAAHGGDQSAKASFWQPAIDYLHKHSNPSYRVEAVETSGHWDATYLPRAGIPLARGWFRQQDFPQNEVLYGRLDAALYQAWLRSLGVRYVVLARARLDYSAGREARLLSSGRSGLRPVMRTPALTIYELPAPSPILTGAGHPQVLRLTETHVLVQFDRAGAYRLAIRYSPYWRSSSGCIQKGKDGMLRLAVTRPGTVSVAFDVDPGRALAVIEGLRTQRCSR